jgi:hypothetical protein
MSFFNESSVSKSAQLLLVLRFRGCCLTQHCFNSSMVVRPKHVLDNLNKIVNNYWNRVALDGNPWNWCNTRNRMQITKFKTSCAVYISSSHIKGVDFTEKEIGSLSINNGNHKISTTSLQITVLRFIQSNFVLTYQTYYQQAAVHIHWEYEQKTRVVGERKLSPVVYPLPGGYKYGNLALQVDGVSDETVKYGYGFCANRTIEWLHCKLQSRPLVSEGAP